MATIIDGGIDAFRALAYESHGDAFVDSLRERSRHYDEGLIGRAREMIYKVRETYESFDLGRAKRLLRAGTRKLKNIWLAENNLDLREVGDFQHANERQRRFIMSCPSVRELYNKNRIEGYGDKYEDPYPNRIGESDPIYRQVMNGMWELDGDDVYFMDYWDTEETDLEEPIDVWEQFDIKASWDRVKNLLDKMDDDPTSPFNNKM